MDAPADPRTQQLAAYVAGEGSIEQRADVERLIATDPEAAAWVQQAARALDAFPEHDQPDVVTSVWAAVQAHVYAQAQAGTSALTRAGAKRGSAGSRLVPWRRIAGVAAAALCGLTVIGIAVGRHDNHDAPVAEQQYATRAGQQAKIVLPNGINVTLAPVSTMRVHDGTIDVTGEAYFDVTSSSTHPLVIKIGDVSARVLGTTFLVRRYTTDRVTRVVVGSGRVAVQRVAPSGSPASSSQYIVLAARQLGTVGDSGAIHVTSGIAIDDYTDWMRGELVFHHAPVRDIAQEVARAYGVDLRVPDSTLAAHTLTWTVPTAHRSLASVLNALAEVLEARVEHSMEHAGDVITLVPGAAPSPKHHPQDSPSSETHYGL